MPRRRSAAVIAGLLLLALCLLPIAYSGFADQTGADGNAFEAGSVALGDDDSGAALFGVGSLRPGDSGSRCLAVTYGGSLPAQVRLFVRPGDLTGTGLARYLTVTVTEGAGGGFGSCAGFTASATVYTGTLRALADAATDWNSGVGAFAPTGSGQVRVYRITYLLAKGAAAAGLSAQARLTWEARNS